ncbi:Hsp20/alpha crystallin family protein [Sphingomonas sp. LaA6.9]|uniref:Hsp20/alpha crystallin family protein n=1 Tax=Sphingomonas sp. LaA6.9 TaxID=2919914 RepID=UPI001F4F5B5D|nr:Hsp20/alpha crystallin family protein [Sphingomonas sp. LaA6.9]MCJ8157028.1 Hsp20/alpha crystallin family protein [Sphingomonas sp. LaA6.9]
MTDTKTRVPARVRTGTSLFDLASQMTEPMGWLRSEIDRIFDDFGRPQRGAFAFGGPDLPPVPALELSETEKEYRLTAELPGLSEQDIDISLADGVLTISGEKKEEKEEKEGGFLLRERRYGAFRRQLAVPPDVDAEGISAEVKDGVLKLTLAKDKKAEVRTRKIAVRKG